MLFSKAGSCTSYCTCNSVYGLFLTDDALMKSLFKIVELLSLSLGDGLKRNASPHLDNSCNIFNLNRIRCDVALELIELILEFISLCLELCNLLVISFTLFGRRILH